MQCQVNSINDPVIGTLSKEGDLSLGFIGGFISIDQRSRYILQDKMDKDKGVQSERLG